MYKFLDMGKGKQLLNLDMAQAIDITKMLAISDNMLFLDVDFGAGGQINICKSTDRAYLEERLEKMKNIMASTDLIGIVARCEGNILTFLDEPNF